MTEFYQSLVDWYMQHMNYWTITGLMAIESSFIPFPSEVVVPPAAWKAAQGDLNIYLVVLFSTFGALIGAVVNYVLARTLGRTLIYRFADTRMAPVPAHCPGQSAEGGSYFLKNGNTSTLIGRLIPGIRQLISIPAGLARMSLGKFLIYTLWEPPSGTSSWQLWAIFSTLAKTCLNFITQSSAGCWSGWEYCSLPTWCTTDSAKTPKKS
jgi:membrane protein DedA with SNARE-associated domain